MKQVVKKIMLLAAAAMLCYPVWAQEKMQKTELLSIHVDKVKPSMNAKYEALSKELVDMMVAHGIKDATFLGMWTDDNSYMWITPIKSMADLDKNMFANLESKVGKEKLQALWDRYDKTYTTHRNIVVAYHPDESYRPERQEGENYRVLDYWYFDPINVKAAKELLKEWKMLYAKHNIMKGYRIFSPVFGDDGPAYVVVSHAKSAAEHEAAAEEVRKKLGEEGKKLWEKTIAITTAMNTVTGYYLPHLSYVPPAPMASGE